MYVALQKEVALPLSNFLKNIHALRGKHLNNNKYLNTKYVILFSYLEEDF